MRIVIMNDIQSSFPLRKDVVSFSTLCELPEHIHKNFLNSYKKIVNAHSLFVEKTRLSFGEVVVLCAGKKNQQYCIPIAQGKDDTIIILKPSENSPFGLRCEKNNHYPSRLITPISSSFDSFNNLLLNNVVEFQNQFVKTVGAKPGSIVFEVTNKGVITGQLAILLGVSNFTKKRFGSLLLGKVSKSEKIIPFEGKGCHMPRNWRILQGIQ